MEKEWKEGTKEASLNSSFSAINRRAESRLFDRSIKIRHQHHNHRWIFWIESCEPRSPHLGGQ